MRHIFLFLCMVLLFAEKNEASAGDCQLTWEGFFGTPIRPKNQKQIHIDFGEEISKGEICASGGAFHYIIMRSKHEQEIILLTASEQSYAISASGRLCIQHGAASIGMDLFPIVSNLGKCERWDVWSVDFSYDEGEAKDKPEKIKIELNVELHTNEGERYLVQVI